MEMLVERKSPLGGAASRARPTEDVANAWILLLAWVALIAATALARPDFLSHQSLLAITFTMAVVGVLAVGSAIVSVSGGVLDLSIPTSLILPALVIVSAIRMGVPELLALFAGVLGGAAWGAFNATIIVFGKLNPIIVTLATNFLGIAGLLLIFQLESTPSNSALKDWGSGFTLGLPNAFWPMVALILVVGFFLPRTRIGRRTIAVGGSATAARSRGVSLRRTRYGAFMFAGACGGIAAILYTGSHAGFSPNDGENYLLPVIAAVILAGFSLRGGRGHVWSLFLSVGFLATVPTSLVFFGLSSDWQMLVQGLVLIFAVSLDSYREKRSLR